MPTPIVPNSSATPALSRYSVDLTASDFQVTATNRLTASKYAADDAHEYLRSWNYTVGPIRAAAGEKLTRSANTEPISILVKESVPDSGRDRLYSCQATVTITVDAIDAFSAGEAALQLVCAPDRIDQQLASYRDQAFWDKLLPVARAPMAQMAEVLRRRGFEAFVRAGDADGARPLAIELSENGEAVGTMALIKYLPAAGSVGTSTGSRAIPRPALHFIGEHDIEVSSIPEACPDLWFNDKPIEPSDIACLDIDAFDQLIDLVLEQREQAREAAEPAPTI
jgi:hypothetical protein